MTPFCPSIESPLPLTLGYKLIVEKLTYVYIENEHFTFSVAVLVLTGAQRPQSFKCDNITFLIGSFSLFLLVKRKPPQNQTLQFSQIA